jgi:hypothetical protein
MKVSRCFSVSLSRLAIGITLEGYYMKKQLYKNLKCSPGVVLHTCSPRIPALRRLRQEDGEFQASLGYIESLCLKTMQRRMTKPRCPDQA